MVPMDGMVRRVRPKLGASESSGLLFTPRTPSAASAAAGASTPLGGAMRRPSLHQADREGKHDGRAALAGNIEQCCEITQLHRLRHRRQDLRGVDQLLRRLLLSFRIDDLGPTRSFGLRLTGDRSYHALVEIDAFDLDR